MIRPAPEALTDKLQAAFRIIADYGRVLGRQADGGVLMPESQLPADRDAIKACILLATAYRIANGAPREAVAGPGRISYATLAHFVPDAVAAREAAFNESAQRALGHIVRKDAPPAGLAESVAAAPVAEMEAARAGYAGLEAEFDAALTRLLADAPR